MSLLRLAALALLLAQAACASRCWVRDTLYFGMSKPGGSGQTISQAEWQSFVDREITPRFPDGLTHWAAQGQWKGKEGKAIKEDSQVLEILHPGKKDLDAKISEIRDAYKKEFGQESVLQARDWVKVEF